MEETKQEAPATVEEQLLILHQAVSHLMRANQEMINVIKALGESLGVKLVGRVLPDKRVRMQWVSNNRIVVPGGRH